VFAVAALIAYCANPVFRSPEDGLPAGALSRIGPVKLARPVRTSETTFLYPDGSYAVISPSGPGTFANRPPVEWWDLNTGRRVPPRVALPANATIVGVGPAGIVTSTEDGYQLRDAKSGTIRLAVPIAGSSPGGGRRGGGGSVPTFTATATAAITRGSNGATLYRRQPDGSAVATSIPVVNDGQWAFAATGGAVVFTDGPAVKRYDVGTGETRTVVTCKEPHSLAYSVDISPDGSVVAVVRRDRNYDLPAIGELYFGNDPTPKPLAEPKADVGVGRVWFTPDGKEIYTVSNRSAVAWDVASGAVVAEYQSDRTNRLIASADGKRLLGTDFYGRLMVINWRKKDGSPPPPRPVNLNAVRWVDAATAVSWGYSDPAEPGQSQHGWIYRWDARFSSPKVTSIRSDESDYWNPIALSADATRLLAVHTREDKGHYRVLDAFTGMTLSRWTDDTNDGFAGPFSPDGKRLLARKNGQTGLYTPDGEKCLVTLSAGPRRGNRGVNWNAAESQFSPDGRLIYVQSFNGLTAYETLTGSVRYTLFGPSPNERRGETSVNGIALSGDGKRMVFDARGRLTLLDPTTGTVLRPVDLPAARGRFGEEGSSVTLSHTGRWLATAHAGTQDILLYDLDTQPTPELVHTFRGATGTVNALAFRPDDNALVSVSSDGTAVTWDVSTVLNKLRAAAGTDPAATWWNDLAADATRAGKAMAAMTTKHPDRAVSLLAERLTPPEAVSEADVKKWVAELDHPDPAVRDNAHAKLKPNADQAEAVLRATLAKAPPAEVRKRVTTLIESLEGPETDPIRLRGLRAVEVLERIGTPAAGALLAKVATGPPGATLTRAATSALGRVRSADQ
jgi:WD40 repeat protein